LESLAWEKITVLAEDSYVQADVAEYQILDFECKVAASSVESLKGL
jgi:hypothetical protein